MTENRIENFEELTNALENLINLSGEITKTLSRSQMIYEGQSAGWYSHNSNVQSDRMIDYSEDAKRIARNIHDVSEIIKSFKTDSYNINEHA